MVRSLWANANKTYIAGDDDQAIFKWAGADVDHFIALKEEVNDIKVLDQSYRIPGGPIHELSQKIISKVQNRFDNDQTTNTCLLYTSPSPRDRTRSRMPSSA